MTEKRHREPLTSLVLDQPARGVGYRVNIDAFLLARFAQPKHAVKCVFDLGAGVGAVGLSMLRDNGAHRAVLIELDRQAAALATSNAHKNGLSHRVEVIHGDVASVAIERRGEAALIVCNPPYITPGRGRAPSGEARARARMGSLDAFLHAARLMVGRRAKACFVYPAQETTTLLFALRKAGLEPKRLAYVHPKPQMPARVVLVEAQAGKPGGLRVEPPSWDAS